MNGVRRFLGGGSQPQLPPPPPPPASATPPPQVSFVTSSKPSWPPQDSPVSPPTSPLDSKSTGNTSGLVIRKDLPKPSQVPSPTSENPLGNASLQSPTSPSQRSPVGSLSSHSVLSPTRKPVPNGTVAAPISAGPSSRVPPPSVVQPTRSDSNGWKRSSGLVNLRDELFMSLLTSEAVVDSRECEILSAEEVEELKKEHHVLKIRLTAMQKKLELETKIRDAALSLSKVNAAHRKVSKQTEEQLEAAERKVVTAQKELWRVSERTTEVYRKLLEHRAGVLGYSVHKMEKKIMPGMNGTTDISGAVTPNRSSIISSATSVTSTPSKVKFDGAHLFAGHADAQIPKAPLSTSEVATLEANLRAATESLNTANKKNAELARELSHLRLEKEQLETTMAMELQSAEETVSALEKELPRFEEIQARCDELTTERAQWEEDRAKLAAREREIERLEGRLEVLEEKSGVATETERMMAVIQERVDAEIQKKDEELSALKVEYEEARANWQAEKAVMEKDRLDEVAAVLEELDELRGVGEAQAELESALEVLHTLMQLHEVDHTSMDTSLQGLLASLGTHLEKVSGMVSDHRAEIEALRRDRDEARQKVEALDFRVKELSAPSIHNGPPIEYKGEVADVIALLQSVWAVLPAPELRASKLNTHRHLRAASSASTPTTPSKMGLPSLSDVDIRSLKALYDAKSPGAAVGGQFSLEAFVARVQALVIDDRSLIERLIRFAQAHDLLKKNAERAQKLAEDSSAALEMYQKQVSKLDSQNFALQTKQAALMNEIQELQAAIERATAEKRSVESHAADQAEICRQLTDANNALSAKALSLAEEVASAPEKVRKQLEGQLAECQETLREAQGEVEAMRTSEQTQRIALLDELNSMQTENANLRTQLRALKK